MNSPHDLQTQLETIEEHYALHFGGKPRITRDLTILDALVVELERLHDGHSSNSIAAKLLQTYRRERAAIADEIALEGEAGERAALIQERLHFCWQRYHRHFAGQSRVTRDLHLLGEIITDLEDIRAELLQAHHLKATPTSRDRLQEMHQATQEKLDFLTREKEAISRSFQNMDDSSRVGVLGKMANDQFAAYERLMVGKPHALLRPETLRRMLLQLETVQQEMLASPKEPRNRDNLTVVAQHLSDWKRELEGIRKARERLSLEDLMSLLGHELNEILTAYNDIVASTEPNKQQRLSNLCDACDELARQVLAIYRSTHQDAIKRNFVLICDAYSILLEAYAKHVSAT